MSTSAATQKYLDALRNCDNQHAYANLQAATSFPMDHGFACTSLLHAERISVHVCVTSANIYIVDRKSE